LESEVRDEERTLARNVGTAKHVAKATISEINNKVRTLKKEIRTLSEREAALQRKLGIPAV
jgi:hypothetical protein